MKHSMCGGILLSVMCLVGLSTTSYATSYNIEWTGANGYSMSGSFEYSSDLTGMINGTQINALAIEGFKDGASVGSWKFNADETSTSTLSNFNFDSNSSTFLTGGRSDSTSGQAWNVPNGGGFGFFSGNSSQGLYVNGALESASQIIIGSTVTTIGLVPSTLRAIPNPEPSTILLFGTGIAALLGYRVRKHRITPTTV